jgi:ribosomal protein S6--L-glutamate ligase
MARLKIGCIFEQRYLRQELPSKLIALLRGAGADVDVLPTAGGSFDPRRGVLRAADGVERRLTAFDGIVARGSDSLGLAMVCHADAAGIPAINTHSATRRVRNKVHMAIALEREGVPAAPTTLAADVSALTELPEQWFPLVLKATHGDNSQGLRIVRRREDLGDIHWEDDVVVAQHYLPNEGFDLRLYVCGDCVCGVRKPSPFNGDRGAPVCSAPVDDGLRDLALRCGRVFGLEVYGVDAVETPDGLAVIDVNEFPSFSGVPNAAKCVADHILARVTGRLAAPAAALGERARHGDENAVPGQRSGRGERET